MMKDAASVFHSQGLLAPVLGVLSLVVAALSSDWAQAQEPSWQPVPNQPPAPSLILPDAGDVLVNLQRYRGRVVLISFWTRDCPPCREHRNALGRLRERFIPGDLVILAVHVGEPAEAIAAPAAPDAYPTLFVTVAKDLEAWDLQDSPTSFLVDRQGRLAYVSTQGFELDQPESLSIIKELLKSRAGQRRIDFLGDDCLPLEKY